MSTAAQQKASRQNGSLSTGPVTPEGKARSAQNATRHGLTGGPVVLPDESQEEYDAFLNSCVQTWRPRTLLELDLVGQMVAANWRLRRIERMEAAILNQAFEREMDSMGDQANRAVAMQCAYAEVAENSKGWRSLARHQRALQRAYAEAFKTYLEVADRTDESMLEGFSAARAAKPRTQSAARTTAPVQNEPEPDYASLKALCANHPNAAVFMPQVVAELKKMNGESIPGRKNA